MMGTAGGILSTGQHRRPQHLPDTPLGGHPHVAERKMGVVTHRLQLISPADTALELFIGKYCLK